MGHPSVQLKSGTRPFEAKQPMLFSNSPVALAGMPIEVSAVASAVVREVYDVLSAVETAPPELSQLAGRAMLNLNVALHEASGAPGDARWRTAYDALAAFLDRSLFHAGGRVGCESFDRLSKFLGENADLSQDSARETEPLRRALVHAHGP